MQNIIYLIIHILFALGMFISFKLVDIKGLNRYQTMFINYIIAITLTIIDMDVAVEDISTQYSLKLILPSVIIGFLFIANFILMMLSIQKVGMGLTTALNKMSVVIPVLIGIIYLGQNTSIILKATGIVAALVSFWLVLFQKKGKASLLSYLLPISVFLVSGTIDTLMELSKKLLISLPNEQELFLLGVFGTAFIFSIIFVIGDIVLNKSLQKFTLVTVYIGIMMGLFNYLTSKMLLINVGRMGGSIVFPIHNSSVVMLTALIGFFFYKEKFSNKQWWGIALAVISVALIASTL
ncbi:MAG: EamA family transporter [Bacteroidales bacterium]